MNARKIKNRLPLSILFTSVAANLAHAETSITDADAKPAQSPYQMSLYDKETEAAFSYADYLYWKSNFGIPLQPTVTLQNNNGSAPSKAHASGNENRLPYASGFRVGLGYRFKENYLSRPIRPWQIEASYERIYTASHRSKTVSGPQSLYRTEGTSVDGISRGEYLSINTQGIGGSRGAEELALTWSTLQQTSYYGSFTKLSNFLGYNRADCKISWPFWIFDNFILKIGTGATFGYLSQENKSTTYVQNLPVNTSNFPSGNFTYAFKDTWWGGGLLFAADTNVDIGYGLGVYLDSSAAFMFGKWQTKKRFVSSDANDNNLSLNDYSYQPVAKVGSGLRYDRWFGKVQLYTSAGWEFNYWWYGINDFDPLWFTGLTARLGVAY